MSDPKYLVGIDLGTSNCAVASVDPAPGPEAPVIDLPIPQLQRVGEVAPGLLLPSCVYIPGEHELPVEARQLPWGEPETAVVGEFARWQGARVPGRLVASAKSWLCNPAVDRTAAILPWGAPSDVRRISPVEASAFFLQHLARAWNYAHPEAPLREQEVIVTVPASFDEVARALTVGAAQQAGLERFTLLEEPQAAFYDFTARHRQDLATALTGVRLVLVIDVGGGTSDFTLVQVGMSPEGPALRRIAVGEHLILGGDNMDAALARRAEERLISGGRKLSATQWTQLVQTARLAKEALLSETAPEQYHVSLLAEGSRLLGGSLSTTLSRVETEQLILDGFFPVSSSGDKPQRAARAALQEIGLPYAHDAAITRHLAAFLHKHAAAGFTALGAASAATDPLPRPDALLLNGGVFNSPKIAARLREVLAGWWPDAPPIQLLEHSSLELAVARGAAYYGLVRRGMGRRITGGAAHALYIGLEKAGAEAPLALCVIPRGQDEGERVSLGQRVFQLTLGRPVRFPLFSSTSDRLERAGEVVLQSEDMNPLPPIHTVLKSARQAAGSVPVHLEASLTEIGTLELWCVSNSGPEQWRLEFELRGAAAQESLTITESMPPRFGEARELVERVFGNKPVAKPESSMHPAKSNQGSKQPRTQALQHPGTQGPRTQAPKLDSKEIKALWSSLERTVGARDEWRVPMLRELWSVLFAGASRRRRSADHERVYFQLLGYSLRPGFGYPLDDWRAEQMSRLFVEGVQFAKEKPVWTEFWVLWRRIAGGLSEERHKEIWTSLKPHLAHRVPPNVPRHIAKPKGVQPEGADEMVRLAAALEHIDPMEKVQLGDWTAMRLAGPSSAGPWAWALGRLGARQPIYGSAHKVVSPDKAAEWLELLLQPALVNTEGALFAASQLARLTGDRTRDLDESLRARVAQELNRAAASPAWIRMVTEVVRLDASDEARALGDTLPVGLQLA
jgi:molecular chaperone DnaK (HSP70)